MKQILPIAVVFLCGVIPAWCQSKAKTAPKTEPTKQKAVPVSRLTIQQIERLIAIHTPDQVVSGEVQSRGLAVEVNRAIVDKLRNEGAGPETVALLLKLIPTAAVSVRTTAGAVIFIDGTQRGVADNSGIAFVAGLEVGAHDLRISKPLFRERSARINLAAGDQNISEAPLDSAIGFLTLRVSPSDAAIDISGVGPQLGSINALPLAIGDHTISVSAPYREQVIRTINIEPGKTIDVYLALNRDNAAIQRLRQQIESMSRSGNIDGVLRQSHLYRSVAGPDAQVSQAVASAYLKNKSYSDLVPAVAEAVGLGGRFSFPVMHEHNIVVQRTAHAGLLTFNAADLQYKADGKCNAPEFTVPLSQVRFDIRKTLEGNSLLILKLPNPANPKKEITMNFIESDVRDAQVLVDLTARLTRK